MAAPNEPTDPERPARRRSEASRLAVLHAADDLVAELGFARVTIEGIAARAGVGKQTIYRWWSSKVDVLLDCLLEDSANQLPVPATGSLEGDLRQSVANLAHFLLHDDAGTVLRALIGEAQHDAEIAEGLRRRYLDQQQANGRAMLEHAASRGELAADVDLDTAFEDLVAPIYHRLLVTGAPLDPAFLDRTVRRFLLEHGSREHGATEHAGRGR